MPPKRVEDSTCASFSYGNGPKSLVNTSTMVAARRNGTDTANAESSGNVQIDRGARPSDAIGVTASRPAPITIVYTGTRCSSRQCHAVRPAGSVSTPIKVPLATARQCAGTSIANDTVALSAGWSFDGNR